MWRPRQGKLSVHGAEDWPRAAVVQRSHGAGQYSALGEEVLPFLRSLLYLSAFPSGDSLPPFSPTDLLPVLLLLLRYSLIA